MPEKALSISILLILKTATKVTITIPILQITKLIIWLHWFQLFYSKCVFIQKPKRGYFDYFIHLIITIWAVLYINNIILCIKISDIFIRIYPTIVVKGLNQHRCFIWLMLSFSKTLGIESFCAFFATTFYMSTLVVFLILPFFRSFIFPKKSLPLMTELSYCA